jgi:predicted Rossmann fold nucleotide-binding protein DprA/Smf involved in DNA uptake
VCPAPWAEDGFAGCAVERKQGAHALTSIDYFLETVGLVAQTRSVPKARPVRAEPREARVVEALGDASMHVDELGHRCGLTYPEVMTAVLTLVLEDVLVEGPEGFFRLAKQT